MTARAAGPSSAGEGAAGRGGAGPRRTRLCRGVIWAVVATLAIATVFFGWLRDLPALRVERVEVTGATSAGPQVREALTHAGREMTTLHVREEALRRAVRPFPVVRSVRADADLPNTLRVEVVEHRPVAVAQRDGRSVPVAGDGTVLAGVSVEAPLPALPPSRAPLGRRVRDRHARLALRVLGAAPPELARRVRGVEVSRDEQIEAPLRNGPRVLLGGRGRLREKWRAAAAVLAHPDSRGAEYVDVGMPDRPTAGPFPEPVEAGAPEEGAPL